MHANNSSHTDSTDTEPTYSGLAKALWESDTVSEALSREREEDDGDD